MWDVGLLERSYTLCSLFHGNLIEGAVGDVKVIELEELQGPHSVMKVLILARERDDVIEPQSVDTS